MTTKLHLFCVSAKYVVPLHSIYSIIESFILSLTLFFRMKKHYLQYLEEVMKHQWGDEALTNYGEEQSYTFGKVAEEMERLQALFRQLGIKKGDKVAIAGRNCTNWVVAYLAVAAYEGVIVSILQDFKAEDISKLLAHSDSKALFVGPYVWKELQTQPLDGLSVVLSLTDFSVLRVTKGIAVPAREDIDKAFAEKFPQGLTPTALHFSVDPDALALINYTSGSTGSPKGVMLTGRSLSNNVEAAMEILPVEPGQRLVSMLPLAHMFGQLSDFLYPLCAGTHIYYLTKSPTPSILLKAMAEVHPYMVATVPLVIEKIYKQKLDPLLSKWFLKACWYTPGLMNIVRNHVRKALVKAFGGNVRYFLCGGAAMNPLVEKCLMDVHFPLSIGYGMTECGPLVGGNPPKYFHRRSCGVPVPNMEVKIDAPDAQGEGEILVRGENVMLGYYKNEEATRAAFTADGWMRTGDLGYMDKHRNIFIKGRNKTMILGASGQNIYPEEIEDKLNNQEGVGESIVVERDGRLVALIFPDEQTSKRLSIEEVRNLMRENIKRLNKLIPGYSQVSDVEIKQEPFEKTPKKSIKRFLYK